MTDTVRFAAAVKRYRDEMNAASQFHDEDLSDNAIVAKRSALAQKAHAQLLAARPVLPELASIDDALDGLRARTADDYAALRHEQTKITALLAAGRSVDDLLSAGSPERVLALIDMAETLPDVLASNRAAELIDELRGSAIDRLIELGVEPVAQARAQNDEWAPAAAWDQLIAEIAEGNKDGASIDAWQNVYQHDAEGYSAAGGFQNDSWAIAD